MVVKYPFEAENDPELTIGKGDLLKLLDRPGTGWLLVKFIDRMTSPGLVPASYVDIAVNDPINPITLDWLQEMINKPIQTPTFNNEYFEYQINNFFKSNLPKTINNKPYPISASISNFYLYQDRYWYRLDIIYSDNSKNYLCKYYQDFYNLHIKLLENFDKIPKLPEPISIKSDKNLINSLLKRCNDLHIYINKLILNKQIQISHQLVDWLDINNNEHGFHLGHNDSINYSNIEITNKVLPNSIDILQEHEQETKLENSMESNNSTNDDTTIETTIDSLPQRTKSKNIYNHYQQIKSTTLPKLSISTQFSPKNSPISASPKLFTPVLTSIDDLPSQTPFTPFTPVLNHNSIHSSPLGSLPSIKCKILTPSNDILAIKLNKNEITNLQVFKKLIMKKIYFNFLFIRLPNQVDKSFHNIDHLNFNLIEFVKHNDKVLLKIS